MPWVPMGESVHANEPGNLGAGQAKGSQRGPPEPATVIQEAKSRAVGVRGQDLCPGSVT